MESSSFIAMLQNGSELLARAIGDPRVKRLADSLHLDLQDPAALQGLLAMTQQYVDGSSEIELGGEPVLPPASHPRQSQHSQDAIRAYREIAAMA